MTGPPSPRTPVAQCGAGQQGFHGLVRLLTEAHDREVSALQAKITELERRAAFGCSEGKRTANAVKPSSSGVSRGSQGTLQLVTPQLSSQGTTTESASDQVASDDYVASMMRALRTLTPEPGAFSIALRPRSCFRRIARQARRLVHWPGFDISVGIIILVNAVMIGVDLEFASQNRDRGTINAFEWVFLGIYTLEFALRVLADGRKCLKDRLLKFDAALLVVGWCSELLHELANAWDGLGPLIVVRLLRFMRFFRAARMVGRWKTLWKLLLGVAGSMETLLSTLIILFFAVYTFTCLSMELITLDPTLREDPITEPTIEQYFSGFGDTMMTTFTFVTMDGAADAISNAQTDEKTKREEMKRKVRALVPQVKQAFQILDRDGSGQVQMEEILNADFAAMPGLGGISHLLTRQALVELYEVFDEDGSGCISEDEFVNGVMQLSLSETSIEMAQVKHLVKANAKNVRTVKLGIEKLAIQLEGGASKATPRSEVTARTSASG